ncbi:MAG: glycosyltransferase family 2 protein [Acidobacteriaceae bacterium]|nr:glycosyltransferase family 2 protein [Acidobacteriaceae bacterium]
MQESVKVSVIVPCRNERAAIIPFLDSLLNQELNGIDMEVLIADGMSNDGTREILNDYRQQHPFLRIIDNPDRLTAPGLNRAIQAASGEIILRMDAHTEYAANYVRRCVDVLQQTGADNVGGPALTRADGWFAKAIAAAYHSKFGCGGARFHDPAYEGYVDTVTYGCWWKSVFDRIGFFDESFVRNQDDEHNLRLTLAGGKVWQSPNIVSWYRPRTSLKSLFSQYFQYGFWKVFVIRKHETAASFRHFVPGLAVLGAMILSLATACAMATGSHSVAGALGTLLLALACAYAAMSITASAMVRTEEWKTGAVLPVVFATYHASYGIGFLWGLLHVCMAPTGIKLYGSAVTRLTR